MNKLKHSGSGGRGSFSAATFCCLPAFLPAFLPACLLAACCLQQQQQQKHQKPQKQQKQQPPIKKKPLRRPTNIISRSIQKNRREQEEKRLSPKSKKLQKSTKMRPGDLKWSQNAFKIELKSREMRWIPQNRYRMAPKTSFPRRGRRFLAIFGSLLGLPKSPKINIFFKQPSQGALFHRFLLRVSFFFIFLLILSRFLIKIQWEKACFPRTPFTFFPTWRPSR